MDLLISCAACVASAAVLFGSIWRMTQKRKQRRKAEETERQKHYDPYALFKNAYIVEVYDPETGKSRCVVLLNTQLDRVFGNAGDRYFMLKAPGQIRSVRVIKKPPSRLQLIELQEAMRECENLTPQNRKDDGDDRCNR